MVLVKRTTKKMLSPQTAMIINKVTFYTGMAIISVMILNRMGISVAAIIGAAGIVGVALGFASQTSVSNIISGLFLISEKSFEIGDLISVGNSTGVVVSIDLLSVKLRTLNNQYLRIPNELIIKSELTNITRYPIRRIDIDVSVAYKEDLERVKDILIETAINNPFCLDEPAPLFFIKDFGNSGINILYGVWCVKSDFLALKNSIMIDVKKRFDAEGIEIPFPHLSIYTGEATKRFPLNINRD
ncbi:MAG: mechanosensitive ion channel family protein [Spirochaetia bacterium]|nr:mechanosensitive ion channel family protein [Spirochaetia bacterium]